MKRFLILTALFLIVGRAGAQAIQVPPRAVKFGPCIAAWSTAIQGTTWEFVGAANGDEVKRKIFADRSYESGVFPEDFELIMKKLHQPGKSLPDAILSRPTADQIKEIADTVALRCLDRTGKTLDAEQLQRCVGVASIALITFNWRYSDVSKHEADQRLAKIKSTIPDSRLVQMSEGLAERVYGDDSAISGFPEFLRRSSGAWVVNDEFGRCVEGGP